MDDKESLAVARQVLKYIECLQDAKEIPPIPELFADDDSFISYRKKILELRNTLSALSRGNLSTRITAKGFIAGSCKSLQANLRHLMWKVNQVEVGDYDHSVDFLGDLSISFNNMVLKLKTTVEALMQKEESLTVLAVSLQNEAKKRSELLQRLKKSEQKFKHLAQHDPLTDLLNRRSFFSFAEDALASAATLNEPCCVAMLDIDNFKLLNDKYGHIEGDLALQFVVNQSLAALRQTDIMGRYGGEEFIFLFTYTGEEHGYIAANRVRNAIEQQAFSFENGDRMYLTASIGFTVIMPDRATTDYGQTLRLGITQADAALYQAKAQGKNRVCLARPQENR